MMRGDVCIVAGGSEYTGKPRPVVILQDDRFEATLSVTVCALTSHDVDAPLVRQRIEPSDLNGLRLPSYAMVDKIVTLPRAKIGAAVGRLNQDEMAQINRAVVVFLGLASPTSAGRASE